jgi:hypothetical protein
MNMACSWHGYIINGYRIFVGKPELDRSLGRPTGMGKILILKLILTK